jgi:hypothetical protein
VATARHLANAHYKKIVLAAAEEANFPEEEIEKIRD